MAMRAGGRRKPVRPKTLMHIQGDLMKFLRQRIPENRPQPTRRELRAAKLALAIIQQV